MNSIIIINGPTGVGKTTIIKSVVKQLPQLRTGITYTTREIRPKDKEDKDMRHITEQGFKDKILNEELLEWAEFSGNYYGTAKKENLDILKNHPLLLNIEVVGTLKIKKLFPNALLIYILPENIEQLYSRLEKRSFSDKQRKERIEAAKWSIKQAKRYDYQIINYEGEINKTVKKIVKIIKKKL